MNISRLIKNIKLYFQEIDRPLFASVVLISILSVINLYGILGPDNPIFRKQVLFFGIGLAVMVFVSFFNYRYLKNYSLFVFGIYLASLVLLILPFFSPSVRGTNSWIVLGNLTFEPAELIKLCLIILMAKYFSQRHTHINQFRHIIVSGIYFAIPALIMIKQPDLGSTIILGLVWLSLLIASGMNKKQILALALIGAVISCVSWFFILKPYQKARIVSFLDQSGDPQGSGYNLIQSKIAIGSGSWLGNGLGKGSQSSLGFLPEPHNDFIFAAFAEQFGIAGISVIVTIVTLMIYRILNVGSNVSSNFGKLFSIGMAVFIFSHVFVSAGVNVGLLPVTGLPFTFLSSGGSHLVLIMAGLGILQSIKRYG